MRGPMPFGFELVVTKTSSSHRHCGEKEVGGEQSTPSALSSATVNGLSRVAREPNTDRLTARQSIDRHNQGRGTGCKPPEYLRGQVPPCPDADPFHLHAPNAPSGSAADSRPGSSDHSHREPLRNSRPRASSRSAQRASWNGWDANCSAERQDEKILSEEKRAFGSSRRCGSRPGNFESRLGRVGGPCESVRV